MTIKSPISYDYLPSDSNLLPQRWHSNGVLFFFIQDTILGTRAVLKGNNFFLFFHHHIITTQDIQNKGKDLGSRRLLHTILPAYFGRVIGFQSI